MSKSAKVVLGRVLIKRAGNVWLPGNSRHPKFERHRPLLTHNVISPLSIGALLKVHSRLMLCALGRFHRRRGWSTTEPLH